MKRKLQTVFGALAVIGAIVLSANLTSCSDNEGWYPEHPSTYNSFFDRALTGYWKLVQVNGNNISSSETNYIYFNGNGGGNYFSYDNGAETVTPVKYNCSGSDSALTQTQLNIQYGSQPPRSMLYWVNNNRLWLQWNSGDTVTTYVYAPTAAAPW